MMVPTIDELRAQCRIDGEHDDDLLTTYAKAARSKVVNYLNRPLFDDSVPENLANGIVITDDIKLAIMLLVSHFYENREPTEIPNAYTFLLEPYRIIPL